MGVDPEVFFPSAGHDAGDARPVCVTCPVLLQCRGYADTLEEGLGRSHLAGIFAGETGGGGEGEGRASPRSVSGRREFPLVRSPSSAGRVQLAVWEHSEECCSPAEAMKVSLAQALSWPQMRRS